MATTYSDSIAKVGRHVFGDAATYQHPQNPTVRPGRGVAPGLGRLQGNAESRGCGVRDLSRSRYCPVQDGPWLFGTAVAVSAGRRVCLAWTLCRDWPLRAQPPPRARRGGQRIESASRAAGSGFRRHGRARRAPARSVRGLDRRSERHLRYNLRPRTGCEHPRFCNARADDAGRMVAHHRRVRRWFSVCGRGPVRQCRVVSADARPACDCHRRHPDVAAGCDDESDCRWPGGG